MNPETIAPRPQYLQDFVAKDERLPDHWNDPAYLAQVNADMSDDCFSMIAHALARCGCNVEGTPAMCYDDAIMCAVGRREQKIKVLEDRLREAGLDWEVELKPCGSNFGPGPLGTQANA